MSFNPDDVVGVLGSTATGAASGSVFGPYGAVIGGAVGLGTGIAGAVSQNQQEKAAEEEQAKLEQELANADQYAFDMMRDVGAANANQRRNVLAEAEGGANRAGIVGGAASQYVRDASREVQEAQGAQMPSIASATAQAIPIRKQQITDSALQKQNLMDMQTATDYLSGAANMMGQGAKLAGGIKDYQDRQSILNPTDDQLVDAYNKSQGPDYATMMDPAASARREAQQKADWAMQQQMQKVPVGPTSPDMSYLRTIDYGGPEARQVLGAPSGLQMPDTSVTAFPMPAFAPRENPEYLNPTNAGSRLGFEMPAGQVQQGPDPTKIANLWSYVQSAGADAPTAIQFYRDAYGEPNFDSQEWQMFFQNLPISMKLDVADMIDF